MSIILRLILQLSPLLAHCNEYVYIMGGTKVAKRQDFPFQASLQYADAHTCGGSIVSPDMVLTAGHCLVSGRYNKLHKAFLRVLVGHLNLYYDQNMEKYLVRKVIVHKDYNPKTVENDIAAIKIVGTFMPYTDLIKPIALIKELPQAGDICTASGWGYDRYNGDISLYLQSVNVPIVNETMCRGAYVNSDARITPKVICAGAKDKDSCTYDSGGPLVCDGQLAGIVSFGYKCGKDGYPGVYTSVVAYSDWIQQQIDSGRSFYRPCYALILLLLII